jgi:hypothetical protein
VLVPGSNPDPPQQHQPALDIQVICPLQRRFRAKQAHIPISKMPRATKDKPVPDAGLERLVVRLELGVVIDQGPSLASGCTRSHVVDEKKPPKFKRGRNEWDQVCLGLRKLFEVGVERIDSMFRP